MRRNFLTYAAAATALIAAPVAVSAQPVANPAASLSVAKSVRAAAPAKRSSDLFGAGILGAVIIAGIVAIGVVAIVNDSDSN